MRIRNRKEEQEEGSPAWMNTYGDMITLLLTFFVLLFSFSTIDAQKWKEIVSAFTGTPLVIESFDTGTTKTDPEDDVWETTQATPVPTPEPTTYNNAEIMEKFDSLYQKIKEHIEKNNLGYMLYVEKMDEAILVRMSDSAFFDSGKALIKGNAEIILVDVCKILEEYLNYIKVIRIEGNTDTDPIRTAQYKSNWELSAARALEVLHYIEDNTNIDGKKLYPAGLGELHPITKNDTEEGKAQNRRVDFVIESIIND